MKIREKVRPVPRVLARNALEPEVETDEVIICLDYAQLELRVCGLFCEDPAMTRILCDPDGDVHTNTANEVGVDRDKVAKRLNFLLIYGGGSYVLSENLTVNGVPTTQDQAKAFITRWDGVYAGVPAWRKSLLVEHQEKGYVSLFTGRKRWLLNVDWDSRNEVHKAETTLSNNAVQGSGQDFLKMAIIRSDVHCINVDKLLPQRLDMPREHRLVIAEQASKVEKFRRVLRLAQCQWLLQVHDESLWRVKRSAADECIDILGQMMVMRHPFPAIKRYSIPLVVDGGWGESWKKAKAKDNKHRVHLGFKEWAAIA